MPSAPPSPDDLNTRIATAVWGMAAAGLLTLSLAVPWLHGGAGRLSVNDVSSSPRDLTSPWLGWALVATAFLCVRAAARPTGAATAAVALLAAVAAVMVIRLIAHLSPAHNPAPGLWLACIGLVTALTVFVRRTWRAWYTRPDNPDPYPDIESRPGRDLRR